jgi:hypothetical protein
LNRIIAIGALLALLFLAFASARAGLAATQSYSTETLSYRVVGGGDFQPPVLQYVLNGKNVTTTLSVNPTTYTIDTDTTWTASRVLPGSNSTERWATNNMNSQIAAGSLALILVYYRQYYVSFSVSVDGNGRSFLFHTNFINFTAFGSLNSTYPGQSEWADYMSPYSYGSEPSYAPGIRWYTIGTTGLIEGPEDIAPLYIEQYQLNLAFSSTGPNPLGSTVLTGFYGGDQVNRTVPAPGGSFWLDYNSSYSLQGTISSGTGSNRWFLNSISGTTADAPSTVTARYIEQFPILISYSVNGGAAPSPPVFTSVVDGEQTYTQLFQGAPPNWVDSGSEYNISSLLLGSKADERWMTLANTSGVANGPLSLYFQYYHQVLVQLSYSVFGGGIVGPSNVSFVSFGVQSSIPISTQQQGVWGDYGTTLGVRDNFPGSSPNERWELESSPTVVLTGPEVLSLVYYHQYLVATSYSITGGGTPPYPVLSGYQFGAAVTSPISSGGSIWLDAATSWSYPNLLQGSGAGERWIALSGGNGTVGPESSLAVSYQHEFYVALSANPLAGGKATPGSWFPAGGSAQLSASANGGWAFAGWTGAGQGSYSGSDQTLSVTVDSPIEETANFYVGFAVNVSGRGSVLVSFDSTALQVNRALTLYVPPGTNITLTAKPGLLETFSGWRGISAGSAGSVQVTVAAPVVVGAAFTINEVETLGLVVLYWGIAIYVVVYLVWSKQSSLGRIRGSVTPPG